MIVIGPVGNPESYALHDSNSELQAGPCQLRVWFVFFFAKDTLYSIVLFLQRLLGCKLNTNRVLENGMVRYLKK